MKSKFLLLAVSSLLVVRCNYTRSDSSVPNEMSHSDNSNTPKEQFLKINSL